MRRILTCSTCSITRGSGMTEIRIDWLPASWAFTKNYEHDNTSKWLWKQHNSSQGTIMSMSFFRFPCHNFLQFLEVFLIRLKTTRPVRFLMKTIGAGWPLYRYETYLGDSLWKVWSRFLCLQISEMLAQNDLEGLNLNLKHGNQFGSCGPFGYPTSEHQQNRGIPRLKDHTTCPHDR